MDGFLILAIETAGGCGSVALTSGGRDQGYLLAEYSLYPRRSHSRQLLGMVQAMLEASAVSWNAVDAVAVSQGPGSFTGLRIGMAAARGLAFAAGKPLIAVPTLDSLAASLPPVQEPVCALLDARKNQVYAAFYSSVQQGNGGLPLRLSPYMVCASASLLPYFTEPVICIGPGLTVCDASLKKHPQVRLAPAAMNRPRAATIGFCAADLMRHGVQPEDPHPLYVRASEAELNLTARQRAGEQA